MYNHRRKSFTNAYNKLPVEESHISPPIRFATFVLDINFYYWKKHCVIFLRKYKVKMQQDNVKNTPCFEKNVVPNLLQWRRQFLTDFDFFTVGNRNELSTKLGICSVEHGICPIAKSTMKELFL